MCVFVDEGHDEGGCVCFGLGVDFVLIFAQKRPFLILFGIYAYASDDTSNYIDCHFGKKSPLSHHPAQP